MVLVKSKDYSEYLVFEINTIRYEPEIFYFKWNDRGNLEGYSKASARHTFTWQPHRSQFTIIEEISKDRIHLKLKKPEVLNKNSILSAIGFNNTWISIIKD